ncbi:hypothetical protein TOPH_00382 [Tolypocladium ophioglossoides CBS 100239]|uniref:Uncharacterized protein n=1 Tax=Tolypocladium ophioglossoides (strain CBS 100239) TaxID=1163406 RepID=A0A0L0NM80_TOLOC|nr:hypothetical protein TOPH_00382 [Tolypocladium ophioglossoides CBS 100239]
MRRVTLPRAEKCRGAIGDQAPASFTTLPVAAAATAAAATARSDLRPEPLLNFHPPNPFTTTLLLFAHQPRLQPTPNKTTTCLSVAPAHRRLSRQPHLLFRFQHVQLFFLPRLQISPSTCHSERVHKPTLLT